jgi:hypothetical protein
MLKARAISDPGPLMMERVMDMTLAMPAIKTVPAADAPAADFAMVRAAISATAATAARSFPWPPARATMATAPLIAGMAEACAFDLAETGTVPENPAPPRDKAKARAESDPGPLIRPRAAESALANPAIGTTPEALARAADKPRAKPANSMPTNPRPRAEEADDARPDSGTVPKNPARAALAIRTRAATLLDPTKMAPARSKVDVRAAR